MSKIFSQEDRDSLIRSVCSKAGKQFDASVVKKPSTLLKFYKKNGFALNGAPMVYTKGKKLFYLNYRCHTFEVKVVEQVEYCELPGVSKIVENMGGQYERF